MEKKRRPSTISTVPLLLLIMLSAVLNSPAQACPSDGSQCKDCILDRFKSGCLACMPILRCMAQCLWGGASRAVCVKKCDCGGADQYPRLSDCKKCMSSCKCSCVA
ncbi:hypothetical protein LOK49_LG09G00119 [Camellia lanceoleosa]|uniref:Uncharacterized protein n=1 Tax=Camellia lanceoleosa TaxID=1840588 RepID=A0ACC0GLA2_9ERIC|nr:hypothetical protein LOK49_LG09G00119 [Camellia lanceoleosa]